MIQRSSEWVRGWSLCRLTMENVSIPSTPRVTKCSPKPCDVAIAIETVPTVVMAA